jgi:hypothetical protein
MNEEKGEEPNLLDDNIFTLFDQQDPSNLEQNDKLWNFLVDKKPLFTLEQINKLTESKIVLQEISQSGYWNNQDLSVQEVRTIIEEILGSNRSHVLKTNGFLGDGNLLTQVDFYTSFVEIRDYRRLVTVVIYNDPEIDLLITGQIAIAYIEEPDTNIGKKALKYFAHLAKYREDLHLS